MISFIFPPFSYKHDRSGPKEMRSRKKEGLRLRRAAKAEKEAP